MRKHKTNAEGDSTLSSVELIATLSPEEIKQRQIEFENHLKSCRQRCENYARLLTQNSPFSWEDIFQESLARAWRSFHFYQGNQPFINWFVRIIRNTFFDALRTHARKGEFLSLDGLLETHPHEDFVTHPCIGSQISSQNQMEWELTLRQVMTLLESPYKETLLLYMIESEQGTSYEEFSEKYGIKLGTLRSRLNRARIALRRQLKEDEFFKEMILAAKHRGKIRNRPVPVLQETSDAGTKS